MITRYKSENAFNATENLLFVPLPIGVRAKFEGFAGQVMKLFPIAEITLHNFGGVVEGGVVIVDHHDDNTIWAQPYSLALCGLHYREENGWENTPAYLKTALDALRSSTSRGADVTLATAGIPGTGFSGLRGAADPSAIKMIMENDPLAITVYQDQVAGDRASALKADPTLDDHNLVDV